MIGQTNLINKFFQYSLDTLPHSIILCGQYGCGKHTLVSMLANHFNVELFDISKKLSYEDIIKLFTNTSITFYQIDISDITIDNQNSLLKFLEEPPNNSYIFILCDDLNMLLSTIVNRCQVFKFSSYSKEELLQFCNLSSALEYCSTPGQCIKFNNFNIDKANDIINKILTKINIASIPNILQLTNQFNYNDEGNLNIDIFMRVFIKSITNEINNNNDSKIIQVYYLTNNYYNKFNLNGINKQKLFEQLLFDIKKIFKQ